MMEFIDECESKDIFDGTPAELFYELTQKTDEEFCEQPFPANVASLSKRINQLKSDFEELGIK